MTAVLPDATAAPATGALWHELWAADPGALVTQGPAWTRAAAAGWAARDVSRAYDFGDRRYVLPLVQRWGALAASMPNAWGIGGLVGGEPRPADVRRVVADLRTLPFAAVRIRPNPLHDAPWAVAGLERIARRAHVIDLAGGFDYTERFSRRARSHVRRAERYGLDVRCDTTGDLVPVFYALFQQSVARWAGRQREPLALARARARARDPQRKLRRIMTELDGAARLWVAFHEGRPAAAILVLQGANAHYTRGAIDADLAAETRASYLLHRLAIEEAARSGCGHYHMGETGTSASLAQFKEAVGARPVPYGEYVVERLPVGRADRAVRTAVKRVLRVHD
ncbi:MAG: hypothetical protein QOF76_3379 [Solirubrobacteraceae bacterium]|jgi:hypothetical protein|nr:hypothetical protein [Solirubrobacteraceae bacterium]